MKSAIAPIMLLLLVSGFLAQAQFGETNSFANLNKLVPDGNISGLSDVQNISSTIEELSRVVVKLDIQGEFNGDLYGYLRHITPTRTNFCILLNRPGRTASNSAGYEDHGFDISFDDSATGDIHSYRLTVTPAADAPLTGRWQPDGRRVDPMSVVDTTARTTTLGSFAGAPASGEWTLFLADVESGGTNLLVSWGVELYGAARPDVTWSAPADIVYGTALGPAQLNASAPVAGTFAYTPLAGTVPNAGANQLLSVTFTPTDSVNYRTVTTNVAINVLKKSLTISADNATKVYGAALPTLSAAYDGLVNGDTPASLDSAASLSTAATAASPVGDYPITVSGASDGNYEISFVPGTLGVTPASLTITAVDAGKIYGAPLPTFSATYSAFVNGDTPASLDTPVALTTPATASSDVGSYSIQAAGAIDANYTIQFVNGTLAITRANTAATLTSSANPATPAQQVTFTFAATPVPPSAATPAGMAVFKVGGSSSPVSLANGVATFSTSSLPVGTHVVEVEYAGNGNWIGLTNRLAPDQLINTQPIPTADQIERRLPNGAKVLIATLLANDVDADGDVLSFVSFSPTTANGGTINRQDDWLYYSAAAGFTNNDSFTYTISDGRGQPVTGVVTVRVNADPVPSPNLTITALANGSYRIRFDGIAEITYRVEYSTLNPSTWQVLGSATANEVGTFEIVDSPPVGSPQRFYRSVYP